MKGVLPLVVLLWTIMAGVEGAKVRFTMYWVTHETEFSLGSDTALKTCSGTTLANVSKQYANTIRLEGSGVLRSGKVLNLSYCNCNGGYNCFEEVESPMGSNDNPLKTYISIAANDIGYGKKVYVQEMDGWKLPNGKTHNGCVRLDDTCSTCDDGHIDFFVWDKENYENLDNKYPLEYVNIEVGKSCTLLDY